MNARRNILSDEDIALLILVADAEGDVFQRQNPNFQRIINHLLGFPPDTILMSLLEALRRLKIAKDAEIAELRQVLHQRDMVYQNDIHAMKREVEQFRAYQQQIQQQQAGFSLSPGFAPLTPQFAPQGGFATVPPLNIAEYGRQVFTSTFGYTH